MDSLDKSKVNLIFPTGKKFKMKILPEPYGSTC